MKRYSAYIIIPMSILWPPSNLFPMNKDAEQDNSYKISSINHAESLGDIDLYHTDNGYVVVEPNGSVHQINSSCCDKTLLKMFKTDTLKKFEEVGYININKNDYDEYCISSHVRGLGGGPALAIIAYWSTKSLCYGGILAAAVGSAITTGGLAGAGMGAAVGGSSLALGTSAAVSGGATVAATAIGASATATAVAAETTAAVAASGGAVGVIAAIESLASAAAAAALVAPTP